MASLLDNLFEAISVFASDGRLYLWNRRFLEDWELDEEWLATHPRVDDPRTALTPNRRKTRVMISPSRCILFITHAFCPR